MDVLAQPDVDSRDADPKLELQAQVEAARAEREDLERQIVNDRERFGPIRAALDTMVAAVWRDVFGQQQSMRERENITQALTFGWMGAYQWMSIVGIAALIAAAIALLQSTGAFIAAGVYLVLAIVGYVVARDQCLNPIRKARSSYLGSDGKDIRLVSFTHYEPGLQHPLIGFDGPTNGQLNDRAWKIPGVREKEAIEETFVEVIDERRSNVLLTRFPDRKPTLVHADLENPFVRAYGVFFQRALERHIPAVRKEADDFREIVRHFGMRKKLDEQLRRLEGELHEYDGTAAIMRALPLAAAVRQRLMRSVLKFRMADRSVRRGLFVVSGDRVDATDVMQTVARASAASLLRLTFSQIKIGYVGQGASTVARIFDAARRTRSIIFIDEAERFFGLNGSQPYEAMRREVVHAILNEWEALDDRADVWIVAVSSVREGLDEGVVARFGTVIDLAPADDTDTTVITPGAAGTDACDDVPLPEPVVGRVRLLAAMFAHAAMMEAQGIPVPRAVLISGGSNAAKQTVVRSLRDQTSLPVVDTLVDDIDTAVLAAREHGRALIAVDMPAYAEPGALAHLAVLIEELTANRADVFIVALGPRTEEVDPELRSRFPEVIDLSELDVGARRTKLHDLLGVRALDFDLESALDGLESQTEGMSEDQLAHFVDDAVRKAALRAIDAGDPSNISIALDDFQPVGTAAAPATKDDEAAL